MYRKQLGQAAELDSYHRDITEGLGAGLSRLVITNQSSVTHDPDWEAAPRTQSGQQTADRGAGPFVMVC